MREKPNKSVALGDHAERLEGRRLTRSSESMRQGADARGPGGQCAAQPQENLTAPWDVEHDRGFTAASPASPNVALQDEGRRIRRPCRDRRTQVVRNLSAFASRTQLAKGLMVPRRL